MNSTFHTHRHDAWVLSLALFDAVFVAVLFAGGIVSTGVSTSLAQVTPPAGTRNAECVSITGVPATIIAGESFPVTMKFKNTGTLTWNPAPTRDSGTGYKFGPYEGSIGQPIVWQPSRGVLPVGSVASGAEVTISFTAQAPLKPGVYRSPTSAGTNPIFGFVMMEEGQQWFGAACGANVSVTPTVSGFIDNVSTDGVVTGWAFDPQSGSKSIDVHYYIDRAANDTGGTFAGSSKTNAFRGDVNTNAGITGNHGFDTFKIPDAYRDGNTHTLWVRAVDVEGKGAVTVAGPINFNLTGGFVGTPLPRSASLKYYGYYTDGRLEDGVLGANAYTNVVFAHPDRITQAIAAGLSPIVYLNQHPLTDASWDSFLTSYRTVINTNKNSITALYFSDEPIWTNHTNAEIQAAADRIERDFPTIKSLIVEAVPGLGVGTGCVRPLDAATTTPPTCIESLKVPTSIDYIGFDAYGVRDPRKSDAWMESYERLKSKRSRDDQKIFIVGDAWWHGPNHAVQGIPREDLAEFATNYYELAKSDPDVVGIANWVWDNFEDRLCKDDNANGSIEVKTECSYRYQTLLATNTCRDTNGDGKVSLAPECAPYVDVYTYCPDFNHDGIRDLKTECTVSTRELPQNVRDTHRAIGQEIMGIGLPQDYYLVTNFNNNGVGSLRDAVSQSNRHVYFNAEGTINLSSDIDVKGSNITIDASAPGNGVTLNNFGLRIRGDRDSNGSIEVHDVTVKKLRVRNAAADGIQVAIGAYNVLIDRVSVHGSADGNLDITGIGTRNVTVQNSIIANPRAGTSGDDVGDQRNMLLGNGATEIHLYNNLIGFSNQRNPEISFDASAPFTVDTGTTVDMRNNILWDWSGTKGKRATRIEFGSRVNVVNNLYGGVGADILGNALTVCRGGTQDQCDSSSSSTGHAFTAGNVTLPGNTLNLNTRGNLTSALPVTYDNNIAVPHVLKTACISAENIKSNSGTRPLDAIDSALMSSVSSCPQFNELFIRKAYWDYRVTNSRLSFKAWVSNHGNVATPATTGSIKIDGTVVATVDVSAIDYGSTRSVKWLGPVILTPGSHVLRFCVDMGMSVPEPDEDNNCIKGTVNVGVSEAARPTAADLIINRFIITNSLYAGQAQVTGQAYIYNQGLTSTNIPVPYEFKVKDTLPTTVKYGSRTILPGARVSYKVRWKMPSTAGKHDYAFRVDPADIVLEPNNDNNNVTGNIWLVETSTDIFPVVTAFSKSLKKGTNSADVKNMQQFLADQLTLEAESTGFYGTLTEGAVREFQADNNLSATGEWNDATRALANEIEGFADLPVAPVLLPPPPKIIAPPPPTTIMLPPPPAAILPPDIVLPPPAPVVLPPPPTSKAPSQVACPSIAITLDIRRGPHTFHDKNSGGQVSSLQEFLWQYREAYIWNLKAIEKKQTFVSGVYGPQTENTIEFFQQQFGIAKKGDEEFGKVYQKTRDEILRQCGALASLPDTSVPDSQQVALLDPVQGLQRIIQSLSVSWGEVFSSTGSLLSAQLIGTSNTSSSDTTPPTIVFATPRPGTTVTQGSHVFSASIQDAHGSGIATSSATWLLLPGGQSGTSILTGYGWIAYAADGGANIKLAVGENSMRYSVQDRAGNSATAEVKITYQSASTEVGVPEGTQGEDSHQSLPGSIRIRRVGADLTRATAPVTDAWVEGVPQSSVVPARNPVQFNGLSSQSAHRASVSNLAGYRVTVATCTYPIGHVGGEGCFLEVDQFTAEGVICDESHCYTDVSIASAQISKVVFKFDSVHAQKKYNIVLILTDDQRADTLGVMPKVQEHLIDKGVEFTRAFSTTPLCCPDRASLLSGGYFAKNTGVLSNAPPQGGFSAFKDRHSMGVYLQRAGYRTALIGKYLNGYNPYTSGYIPYGWNLFVSPGVGNWKKFEVIKGSSSDTVSGVGVIHPDIKKYRTDYYTDEALAFLRTGTEQPFFLLVSTNAPHAPATPAEEDRGRLFSINRAPSYMETDISDKPAEVRLTAQDYGEQSSASDVLYSNQLRSLQAVDRAVDAIVKEVDRQGKLEDTIFIYTSDNGYLWGEHGLSGKMRPYEESIKVPFVVRMHGISARKDDHIVSPNLDIGSTLYEVAGISRRTDGSTLIPLLRDSNAPWRQELYLESYLDAITPIRSWTAIRSRAWKYIEYVNGEKELYDLAADPYEMNSMHASAQAVPVLEEYARKLQSQKGVMMATMQVAQGVVGRSYYFRMQATGGAGVYTWSVANGSLPRGLRLDAATGAISGKPEQDGSREVTIRVRDTSIARYTGMPREHMMSMPFDIYPAGTEVPSTPRQITIAGGLTSVNNSTCSGEGWAVNIYKQKRTLKFEVYVDGIRGVGSSVAVGDANGPTPEIESDEEYMGDHGFIFTVPVSYKDALPHQIYVYGVDVVKNEAILLPGGIRTILCAL